MQSLTTETPGVVRRVPLLDAALVLLLAIPWLEPFAPGPSANVVPWLVSAACGLIAFAFAAPVAPSRRLALVVVVGVLLVAVRPVPGVIDRSALAGGCALVLLAYAVARGPAPGERSMAELVAWSWLLAALLSSVLALLQYFHAVDALQPWVYPSKAGEAFANLRQRNQFATLTSIGLAALLWMRARDRDRLAWWVACAILLAIANAATTSRTGLAQWIVLLALTALWRGPARSRTLPLCAAALVAYLVAAAFLPTLLQALTGMSADTLFGRVSAELGCDSRRVLWSNVLTLIGQRPWVGWGWGELDYAHYLHLYGDAPRFCDILDNAHNLPLHVAVELGIPAAVVLTGLVLWAVLRARPWREIDPGRQLAWGVVAAIAIHSLLEYPLWYGPFQLALGLAIGLLASAPIGAAVVRPVTRAAIAACGLALVGYAAWDYDRVSQIYLEPEQRRAMWRDDTLAHVRRSWLFSSQAEFAELTLTSVTPANVDWAGRAAADMLHYSPEPRVIERLIEAETMEGRLDEAVLDLARFRAAFPEDYEKWRAAQKGPITSQ